MRPEELARWNELAPFVEHHRVLLAAQQAFSPELLHEIEEYWKGVAPGQVFDPREAVALAFQNLKRYEAALLRIVDTPQEQETLMRHRKQTGQEVPESDEQRYFAFLKVAHIAAEALGTRVPVTARKNLDKQEP
jgi:hypothetical protein